MNFLNTQSKTLVRTPDAWVIGFKASAAHFDFYETDLSDLSEINSDDVCVLELSLNSFSNMDSDISHSECKRINIGSHTGSPIKAINYRLN